jgi:hypothetical protein
MSFRFWHTTIHAAHEKLVETFLGKDYRTKNLKNKETTKLKKRKKPRSKEKKHKVALVE